MHLDLNAEEKTYLDRILSNHMTELIWEINHTDSHEYRQSLKNEAELLTHLKVKLESEKREMKSLS